MTSDLLYDTRLLKQVATINNEALSETTDPDYLLRYVDIGNVDSSGTIHEIAEHRFQEAPSRARRIVRDGDVIVSTVRTYLQAIAPIVSPPQNLIVSTGFAVVRPKPEVLDPGFCKYALREPYFIHEVMARSVGVSYPAINASELANIPIRVPPLQIQRAIANFLDYEIAKSDALIVKKRQLLKLLEERRQAIITHAVTSGLNADAPMKDSGVEWLGEIPDHWMVIQLRQALASFEYGISTNLSGEGQYKVLTMGHIVNGRLTIPDEGCLEEEPEIILEHHDLVFNRTNSLEQVGKVGIFEGQKEDKISIASYLVRLRSNDRALPVYLNYLLNSNWMLAEARARALPSINQANLNPSRYTSIPIPLPPVIEQMEIVTYLDQQVAKLDGLQDKVQVAIDRLQERRIALISEAVTGKIKVTE